MTKSMNFRLPTDVWAELYAMVLAGDAPSINAAVVQILRGERPPLRGGVRAEDIVGLANTLLTKRN